MESRLLNWLSIGCTLLIVTPVARQLLAEYRAKQVQPEPPPWRDRFAPSPEDLRGLYDGTR